MNLKGRITKEEQWRILDLYERCGFSIKEIAAELDRPPTTIYSLLRRWKVPMRPRGQRAGMGERLNHEAVNITAYLYHQGYTSTEIGTMLGINHSSVTYRLHHAGISLRSRSESLKLRNERKRK